jgi:hypothetical protein
MTDVRWLHLVVWFVVLVICPALFLVLGALGLLWRRRTPIWLPLVASVALLAYGWLWADEPLGSRFAAVVSAWCLVGMVLLILAAVGIANRWRSRGALLVAGLAVPAPLLALFFVYIIVYLASL